MNIRSLKRFSVLLVASLLSVKAAHAAVWETTQTWTPAWEERYQDWVKTNWNKLYFTQSGPLQGLELDCADTVYSMRVLFSSMNGLPFVIKDPTTSSANVISNELTRFDNKTPDERIRSFAKLIMSVASTASLPNDTYPVAISRARLGSGSLLMTDREATILGRSSTFQIRAFRFLFSDQDRQRLNSTNDSSTLRSTFFFPTASAPKPTLDSVHFAILSISERRSTMFLDTRLNSTRL